MFGAIIKDISMACSLFKYQMKESYKKLRLLLENLFNLEDTSLYQPA